MKIPPELKNITVAAITGAFSESQFEVWVNGSVFGLKYSNFKLNLDTFPVTVDKVIDDIWRRKRFGPFLTDLITARPEDAALLDMQQQFNSLFTIQNGELILNPRQFSRQILNNHTLLFIGREHFADSMARMVNRNGVANLLNVAGVERVGRSYIDYYLTEVMNDLGCFDTIYLNLRKLGRLYPEGEVEVAHLAEQISIRLEMNWPGVQNFKYTQFLPLLETRFKVLRKTNEEWLIFIDQFDYLHNKNVKDFLRDVAGLVLKYPNIYLLFSSYDGWNNDWDINDVLRTEEVKFGSFSLDEIKEYLGCLYDRINLRLNKTGQSVSRDAFIKSGLDALKPEFYDEGNGPNVEKISTELKIWFRHVKEKYKI